MDATTWTRRETGAETWVGTHAGRDMRMSIATHGYYPTHTDFQRGVFGYWPKFLYPWWLNPTGPETWGGVAGAADPAWTPQPPGDVDWARRT